MQEVTVTELSRGLSEFINRATYLGETFLIVRAGKPVAHLAPVPAGARVKDLRAIFDSLPALHPGDLKSIARDLGEVREALNEPVRDRWGS